MHDRAPVHLAAKQTYGFSGASAGDALKWRSVDRRREWWSTPRRAALHVLIDGPVPFDSPRSPARRIQRVGERDEDRCGRRKHGLRVTLRRAHAMAIDEHAPSFHPQQTLRVSGRVQSASHSGMVVTCYQPNSPPTPRRAHAFTSTITRPLISPRSKLAALSGASAREMVLATRSMVFTGTSAAIAFHAAMRRSRGT